MAVYLRRGRYRSFPSSYVAEGGGHTNTFEFPTVRLWEHAGRIRGGDLVELAPLLVLCEDKPDEGTLHEEREIILGLKVSHQVRADLLATAFTVATRYFSRDLLQSLFQKEMEMAKHASIIEEWIEEGKAEGKAEGAREIVLEQVREKFGEVPAGLLSRIETSSLRSCRILARKLVTAQSVKDLT